MRTSVFFLGLCCCLPSALPAAEPIARATLEQLADGQLKVLDLTYPIDAKNAFWPAPNYFAFESKSLATLEKDGVSSKAFSMPEHLGTHVDAPNHFVGGQASVADLTPPQFFGPAVVIDAVGVSAENADFALSQVHVELWESRHGRIPTGAIVFLHTGWGRHWGNALRYQNRDARGQLHFPGFASDAADFLLKERKVRALGIDTLSIDPGTSREFPVHKRLGKAGAYALENVAHLDQMPAQGSFVFVAPIKLAEGTGGPTRIFAFTR